MSAAIPIDESALLVLPRSAVALDALELVTRHANTSISNHSLRSFLFARLVARARGLEEGRDYDADLLFCACVLHDIGATGVGTKGQRFEVAGADAAAELLTRHGFSADQVDLVWQAIALNTSPGIVERRGTVPALTLAGVALDFGFESDFISDATAARIHAAYPRLAIGRALSDAVAAQASLDPRNAPLFSMPAQLLRERATGSHVAEIERLARAGRWGE